MNEKIISADKLKRHYAWWDSPEASDELKENKKTFDTIIDLQPEVPTIIPPCEIGDTLYWLDEMNKKAHPYTVRILHAYITKTTSGKTIVKWYVSDGIILHEFGSTEALTKNKVVRFTDRKGKRK